MALNINVSKNHYYVKKPIEVDVELNQTYPDSYKGGSASNTITISNGQQNRLYLFNSEVPNTDRNATIDELYFNFDVNSPITQETQNNPTFLVYSIKDLYTITEGTSTVLDKNMSVYSSILDHNYPLESEDFDGTNKGFGRDEVNQEDEVSILRRIVDENPYSITYGSAKEAYLNGTDGTSVGKRLYEDIYDDRKLMSLVIVPIKGFGEWENGKGTRMYYLSDYKSVETYPDTYPKKLTLSAWQSFGAIRTPVAEKTIPQMVKSEFEQTYIDAVTPQNSIFNIIHKEHDVYDIKVQTLESVGGDQYTFTANNFNLTNDDVFSGQNSARMHLFWENYSGTSQDTGASSRIARSLANCYGSANKDNSTEQGLPQTMYATISNIPTQRTLDLVSGSGAAPGTPKTANCMPEIEIVFKVKQLGPAVRTSTVDTITLNRSINFLFGNISPKENETFWEYCKVLNDNSATSTGYQHLAGVVNSDTASGSFTLFDVRKPGNNPGGTAISITNNVQTGVIQFPFASGSVGNTYGVELPFNEWITMRMRQYQNGESTLVYFPDLPKDSSQTVPNLVIDGAKNTKIFGGMTNLTIAVSNFRAIDASSTNQLNINNQFGVDLDGGENDRQVEMLIDSIKFLGFNHRIRNSTQGKVATSKSQITIDSDTFVKVNPTTEFSATAAAANRASKSANDNYYTLANTPSPTVMSFGFDSIGSLDDTFLQFNNFKSVLGATTSSITNNFIKWGYSKHTSTNALDLGPVQDNCINLTQTTDIETDGALFVDNFSKKGFVKITASGVDSTNWKAGPNPWVSAIIKTVSDDGRTIQVDNPEVFDEPVGSSGQKYVAFRQASTAAAAIDNNSLAYSVAVTGTNTVGLEDNDLYQIKPREGNTIFLNRSISQDDKGNDMAINKHNQIGRCLISPIKYWLWGMVMPYNTEDASSTAKWGEWYDNTTFSGSALGLRSYDSVELYSNTGTVGTTYNEFLYNDGTNQNQWIVDYKDTNNILDMENDYGYGAYKEADGDNPAVIGGYITKEQVITTGSNYFNLSRYASENKLNSADKLNFAMYPYLNNALYYSINIDSAEGTTPPNLIFGYDVPLSSINDLTVSPKFDFLQENANIDQSSKSTGTDIVFNWSEVGSIDYRVLFVDTEYIKNKYHKSRFIAPLNESTTTTYKFYSGSNAGDNYINGVGTALTNSAGTDFSDIEGAQGYATKFTGSSRLTFTTNPLNQVFVGQSKWTIMMTLNPSSPASTSTLDQALTMTKQATSDVNFAVGVDQNNKIQFTVTGSTKLTSTTAYAMNGKERLNVIITYDKTLDTDNLKLYVNGKLEDTADYTTNFETKGRIYIGGDEGGTAAAHFNGHIEEISTHATTAYVVPNNRRFTLSTKTLPDLSSGVSNAYQARMFGFDGTNIRGFNKSDVATSDPVSWKITGVA